VPCPCCNCRIEKVIPCFCWEAESWEDRRNDYENDNAISIREKWIIDNAISIREKWYIIALLIIMIIIVFLDIIAVLVLLDDPSQLHVAEIFALLTIMSLGTSVLLYVAYCSLPEEIDDISKFVEPFFSVLGVVAFVNLSFITARLASFPFPLALIDRIWCLRLISRVEPVSKPAASGHKLVRWTLIDCTRVYLTWTMIRVCVASTISALTPPSSQSLYLSLIIVNTLWWMRNKDLRIS
jgi:hypothetical protein